MFVRRTGCALAVIVTLAATVPAQRLPNGVHPEHYALTVVPDLGAATFRGEETIDVMLDAPSKSITLNAAEIMFQEVSARIPSSQASEEDKPSSQRRTESIDHGEIRVLTGVTTLDNAKEQATFTFSTVLPAGKISLKIRYTGVLNNKLRGFYLSKTKMRSYAVTQFEPTDARRAFPCFDEPALKASFDITLIVDSGDTAISNTNIVSDKAGPIAGKHTLRFATTPAMSTYLVAYLVGDFKCTEGRSDGVPIRACSTPDKVGLTRFAVESAKYLLHYYDLYFGIKYPLPKLDMVALPDFESGAMENFGCITYREADLLVDERTGDVPEKKRVAVVVAHEMAHQWFGDLVTMQWWDNLWLNEGFATWMETKPVAEWHPEWSLPEEDAQNLSETLDFDARRTTRAIRATAETPDEINEMFDGITYGKAGAVIGMVENYLGKEVFRQGVHDYLQAHLYANATSEDFWSAQTANSHLPVDEIMSSFVSQPGVPLLTFLEGRTGEVPVKQSRFFLPAEESRVPTELEAAWTIPVCLKTNGEPICRVLTPHDFSVRSPMDAGAPFLYANAAAKGYYRTVYTPLQYKTIVARAESSLTAPERIGLLGDLWAQVRSGKAGVGDSLNLMLMLKEDHSAALLESALEQIETIDSDIASEEDRSSLAGLIRREFGPVYKALGRPIKNEPYDRRQLRGVLFELLGNADDPDVLVEAHLLTDRVLAAESKRDKSIDPTLSASAVQLSTSTGDSVLYDKILAVSANLSDPAEQADALRMLGRFRAPVLVERTLDYIASGQVRNQDSWTILVELLSNRETRDQAWEYMEGNWPRIHAQLTVSSGEEVIAATGYFCTVERRNEIEGFFAAHRVEASDRTLEKTLDRINDCIQLRSTQEPMLHNWLKALPK